MGLFKKAKKETYFDYAKVLREEKDLIKCYEKNQGHPIKTLFGLYSKHKWEMIISTIFFVIKCMPMILLPILTSNVINAVTYKEQSFLEIVIYNGLFGLLILVGNIITTRIHLIYFNKAKRSVEASLRGAMVRKLQELSISFHKETAAGKIQSKIIRDVEAVEGYSAQMFTTVIMTAFYMIITLIIILTKNPIIFVIVAVCAPLSAIISYRFKKSMVKVSRDFRIKMEKTSSQVMDMVELIPVTRAHALEEEEIKKNNFNVTNVAESGYKFDYIQGMFGVGLFVTFTFFQIVCLLSSGYMAYKGLIKIGDITLYQSYFNQIVGAVSTFLNMIPMMAKGNESIISIGEIMLDKNTEDNDNKEKLKHLHGSYEFKDVRFQYDENTPVLKGLDLSVKAGETIALVGESGAGKTTILNMVIGFEKATSGQILIDGKDMKEIDLRSYRRFISVVPQNTVLFSGTIRDNITYGREDISDEELEYVIDMAKLRSVIDKLPNGLDTKIGEHGSKLSGGQRQRISIARAIIRHPDVIIFDEATSAIDTATEKEIQEAINNVSIGRTTFIVAHRLSTIRNADRIAVIKQGKCVEIGSYEELMVKKGEFYNLKKLQS